MGRLLDFRKSVYSQNGEDGVIAEIFRRLPSSVPRWYVEFGAWDGRYGSNCYTLALQGWHGIMIEGDQLRFKRLEKTAERFPGRMITLCRMVESGPHLEELLSSAGVPHDFGLLSIDIDSSDYDIWKGMEAYRPAVVVIEIDSGTPPGTRRVWSGENFVATTFTSMVELGQSKGYTLICHTGNLVFVRGDLSQPFAPDLPANVDDLFIRDWVNPTSTQVWRRKIRWMSPQRAACKAREVVAGLTGKGSD
jgi:hypothetical protein